MRTPKEIETRADLEFLLGEFYKIAPFDEQIGHHFAETDLAAHLPIIVNFWEKVLFGKPSYFGNPFVVHKLLNAKSPLTTADFERWLEIFSETVDKFFFGVTAQSAKERASLIAQNMQRSLG